MNATVDFGDPVPTPAYRLDGLEVREGHVPSTVMAFLRASLASDRERLSKVLAVGLTVEDHRRESLNPIPDRDGMIDSLSWFGPNAFDIRMLSVRGDSFGMFRVRIARTEGGVADILVIARCTEAGQMDMLVLHDTTDLAGATMSLSRLWGATLPPDQFEAGMVLAQLAQCTLASDVAGAAKYLSPSLRSIDRRDGEFLVFEGPEAEGAMWANLDGPDDQINYATEVHVITGRGLVFSHTFTTVERLGLTEPEVLVVGVKDGLVDVLDFFDGDDLAAALERFSELD